VTVLIALVLVAAVVLGVLGLLLKGLLYLFVIGVAISVLVTGYGIYRIRRWWSPR